MFVGCAVVWAGFRGVVPVPATIAERGPDSLCSVCLSVVDEDAVLLVVDRVAAFGLADTLRGAGGAGGAGDASVGASDVAGASSLFGWSLIEGLLGFEQRIDLACEMPKRFSRLGRVVLGM